MKQVIVRLAASVLTALLGIGLAQAADTPAPGTLVPGVLVPGMPAPSTRAPAAPVQEKAAPQKPAPDNPAAEAPASEKAAPEKPAPRKSTQHRRPAAKPAPAKEAVAKPSGVEEATRTCIHDRLRALIAQEDRGDVSADPALNACTNDLKAEMKAKKKSYCEAVAYIGWLVADENNKLNGISGEPYRPDRGFLQDCAKTESWEKHR